MSSPEQIFREILLNLTQVLTNAQHPDPKIREAAEKQVNDWEVSQFPLFLLALTTELVNEEKKQSTSRLLAGILLKNALDAKDLERKQFNYKRWIALDNNTKGEIKNRLSSALTSPWMNARSFAAQAIAKIALIELPRNLWPQLIPGLLGNMTNNQIPVELKQSTLETFGYICEEIDPTVLAAFADQILTAVVQGMREEEQNPMVKLAATKALNNALEFSKKNFEKDDERNFIMKVVTEAASNQDKAVRIAAFECLVRIASLYYEKLTPYMQAIFTLSWRAIKEDQEEVAQQAVEFWSTICDEELLIIEDNEENNANRKCHYFIKAAVKYLAPVLTEALTKSDGDDEDWSVSMAAGTCLNLIANTVEDEVVPHVIPFVEAHIVSQNWKYREAATLAFGSILEGPDKAIKDLITQALPVLLDHMNPQEATAVKDTTAWTLGRIAQLHEEAIGPHMLRFIKVLLNSLGDKPKVASNVCWAINNLGEVYNADSDPHPLAGEFNTLIGTLIQTSERPDADEANLRCSAYEALNAVIQSAPDSCTLAIQQLVAVFLERLAKSFQIQVLNRDDKEKQAELQGLLCGVLQTITRKLDTKISVFSDQMMMLYLRLFQTKGTSSLHEEALMAVGALVNAIDVDFEKYIKDFHPFLIAGLSNWQEYQVCSVAVGIVGDIARAITTKLLPSCDQIITHLLTNLQNPYLNRSVKPVILSCFGDIALAIGGHFEKYLTVVMDMLKQAAITAAATRLDQSDDYDLIEYMNQLREGIFEAYSGIIQGLNGDGKADMLLPHSLGMLQLIAYVTQDGCRTEDVSRAAAGLLGDLAHSLGSKLNGQVQMHTAFAPLLDDCINSGTQTTKETAEWAKDMIQQNCK